MNDNDGLLDKYVVFKLDGEGPPDKRIDIGEARWLPRGGPHETVRTKLWFKRSWTFVLDPTKENDYGAASRSAMIAYANVIRNRNPRLSDDLKKKVDNIQKDLGIWEGPKK